jgi:hypothetical protein
LRAALTAACLAAAAGLAACGGEPTPSAPAAAPATPVGELSAGSVVQYADCTDWRRGTVAERQATVVELRSQLTPQTSTTAASPLADDRAYAILQKSCRTDFADSLRLYKLYVRAQAYAPLSDP